MGKNVPADSPDGYWYPGAIPFETNQMKKAAKPGPYNTREMYDPRYPETGKLSITAEMEKDMFKDLFPQAIKPDGGPQKYYDFPAGAITLNDLIEYKNMDFHLGNIFKAVWRYGTKEGTSKDYDCRKIIYSGARKLKQEVGVEELRKTLQGMLDDPQFQ